MSDTPTTWLSGPRPACATEEMIEAGVAELLNERPILPRYKAWPLARNVINAALAAIPKPPPIEEGDRADG